MVRLVVCKIYEHLVTLEHAFSNDYTVAAESPEDGQTHIFNLTLFLFCFTTILRTLTWVVRIFWRVFVWVNFAWWWEETKERAKYTPVNLRHGRNDDENN